MLCWPGTPSQLPVKLSVGPWRYTALSPVKKPQITPLVLFPKNMVFTLCCFHSFRHVVGLKEGELKKRMEEEDAEKYMWHITLLIPC